MQKEQAPDIKLPPPPPDSPQRNEYNQKLRNWWHNVLRKPKTYACYGFLIALSTDKVAIEYLEKHSDELHKISGSHCLIIVLQKSTVQSFGRSETSDESIFPTPEEVRGHIDFSRDLAKLLKIPLKQLPCLVFFRDIRKPEREIINLRGLDVREISYRLRAVFDVLDEAVNQKKDPLDSLKDWAREKEVEERNTILLGQARKFLNVTIEKAIGELVKSATRLM